MYKNIVVWIFDTLQYILLNNTVNLTYFMHQLLIKLKIINRTLMILYHIINNIDNKHINLLINIGFTKKDNI